MELRVTGLLGEDGTNKLMAALSAAADTLEELCVSGAVVVRDVLVQNDPSGVSFRHLRVLTLMLLCHSISDILEPVPAIHLRIPGGLRRLSIHSKASIFCDFTAMRAVTGTLSASASSIQTIEICGIQWLNSNDTLAHLGCYMTADYGRLTTLALSIHNVSSPHTLSFVCMGLLRLKSLGELRLEFTDTLIHGMVGETLCKHPTIHKLWIILFGSSRVPPSAEQPLSLLAHLPALSHMVLHDRRPIGCTNRAALNRLDEAALSRGLQVYEQK
jgi:hypothetical protein